MKNLLLVSTILLSINLSQAFGVALFQTSCRAELTSSQTPIVGETKSEPFQGTVAGFANSGTNLDMGEYLLVTGVAMQKPFGSPSMEPTLWMSLHKKGNPISGKKNEVFIQGLDLEGRALNKPLRAHGIEFLNFDFGGSKISRVDYSCSLTKIQANH